MKWISGISWHSSSWTFVAMALGPILVGELRSGKLCIAAKKKKKEMSVCVCVCVCVWKGKTFYWINY